DIARAARYLRGRTPCKRDVIRCVCVATNGRVTSVVHDVMILIAEAYGVWHQLARLFIYQDPFCADKRLVSKQHIAINYVSEVNDFCHHQYDWDLLRPCPLKLAQYCHHPAILRLSA